MGEVWQKYSQFISLRVQHSMEEKGVTQKALAQRMGCSQQQVSALLKGNSNLTLETIARIERALGVDIIKSAITHVQGYDGELGKSDFSSGYLNEPEAEYRRKPREQKAGIGRHEVGLKYPIGIQTFENIIEGGWAYVDKTRFVYDLATTGKFFFLNRPRRFGKSLLLSTLEAYFEGKWALFEGLEISSLEDEWIEYPVLYMDFTGSNYSDIEALDAKLNYFFEQYEKKYSCLNTEHNEGVRFAELIDAVANKTGKQVVILIDEYDKPVVDNLTNTALSESLRNKLQGLFSVVKAKESKIRFCMLTGVSKLGKLSVFSALNNLYDISMDNAYSEICGITEEELRAVFDPSIAEMANTLEMSKEECYAEFKKQYDGYHFCEGAEGLYNPFSVLNALSSKSFRNYWFETGTPGFLVNYLKDGGYVLDDLNVNEVSEAMLTGAQYDRPEVITLLYQTGYLTIKDYDTEFRKYKLDYPNREVETGFIECLSRAYTPLMDNRMQFSVSNFVRDIKAGDVESLMNRFTAFFADSDYQVQGNLEIYFQNTFAVMLKMMGFYVQTERHTSNGRIDVVFDTEGYVFIIEIKRDGSAADALTQIKEKGYDRPYLASGKKIFTIGVNFSTETKRIEEWILE